MQSIFKMRSLANFCGVVFQSRARGLCRMGTRWLADAARRFGSGTFIADVLRATIGGALMDGPRLLSAA